MQSYELKQLVLLFRKDFLELCVAVYIYLISSPGLKNVIMVQYALFQDEHGWSEHQTLLHCLRKSKNKNILLHLSSQSISFSYYM